MNDAYAVNDSEVWATKLFKWSKIPEIECRSIFEENGVYGCKMIHTLFMAGNQNAKVLLTQNRGYRLDGTRHPHSWNIVDEKEFVKWVKMNMK